MFLAFLTGEKLGESLDHVNQGGRLHKLGGHRSIQETPEITTPESLGLSAHLSQEMVSARWSRHDFFSSLCLALFLHSAASAVFWDDLRDPSDPKVSTGLVPLEDAGAVSAFGLVSSVSGSCGAREARLIP
jgi:hypothetical protein